MKRLIAVLGLLGALVAPLPAQTATTPGTTVTQPGAGSTSITTTAPVSAETTISVGTLAGQVLMWIATAFSVPVGTLLSMWLFKLMQRLGVETTMQQRDKLKSILINGLNAAAAANAGRLQGKGQMEIRNVLVAEAIGYAQKHGADTIKALGLDPQSGDAVAALKAHIATAIADPMVATPSVLKAPDIVARA